MRFFQISILQGYGRTLLHQRRSKAAVRRFFTKYENDVLQNSQETPMLESLFNKVEGLKTLHHNCFSRIFAKLLRKLYNITAIANLN